MGLELSLIQVLGTSVLFRAPIDASPQEAGQGAPRLPGLELGAGLRREHTVGGRLPTSTYDS
ncbi:hypothetical protein [Streptomyces resistomycificus]|uniref:hypothetical protein n=1 Tax=Streptomyces resistomycificus TaxID=67356 RepID=UPI000FE27178|nr:hypothetical protein [Streptomyces resistomycificus]